MNVIHTLQPSFASGELSPRLHSQVNLKKYATGLKTAKNFIIHSDGGASNRPGTYYVATAKKQDTACRLFTMQVTSETIYVLEFGVGYIRFFTNNAPIVPTSVPAWNIATSYNIGQYVTYGGLTYKNITGTVGVTPGTDATAWEVNAVYEVPTPYTETDLSTLKFLQIGNELIISCPNWPLISFVLDETFAGTQNVLHNWPLPFQVVGGPFMAENVTTATIAAAGTLTAGNIVALTATADTFVADHAQTLVYGGLNVTQPDASLQTIAGTGALFRLRHTTHAYGVVQILTVTDSKHASALVLSDIFANTATATWSEGSWSKYRGFPGSIGVIEERLSAIGTKSEPNAEWLSKTGIYEDFGTSVPLVDSDAISATLPSRKLERVRNQVELGKLLVLTTTTDYLTGSASGGDLITPLNIKSKGQGQRGSALVDPVIVGDRAIVSGPRGTTMREIVYNGQADTFQSQTISLFSGHLFREHSIVDMAYQQEPDSIVWCVRDDGVLLALTLVPEQEVMAWTRCVTDGHYESVCIVPGDKVDDVWFVVRRGENRFIERMTKRLIYSQVETPVLSGEYTLELFAENQHFVDCGLAYDSEATDIISGLDHLEGKTVAILADGAVLDQQEVVSGSVTLAAPASVVHVGLPYTADLETLNIDMQLQDGTLQGRLVKITEVTIRFEDSRGGFTGPDADSLDEIVQDALDPMDEIPDLFTGEHKEIIDANYELGGRIFFRQTDPLPVTILAVIPTLTEGGP